MRCGKVGAGMVRLGNERQDGCGKVWTGAVRFGMVTNGRNGAEG